MQKQQVLKVHLIAIGGSVMHNLAIALHKKGLQVSGSDDEIFEPSRSRLTNHNLLPEKEGWFPEKITKDLDCVILGMHARPDNPELQRAQELGIKIYSYPEFIYEQSKDKQRIIVAGSHGKTTIAAIIMHVLKYHIRSFDYLVGAEIEGFDTMVKLSDAPIIIIEGDEFLSSVLDKKPKLLNYFHHVGLVNGVAWDHINVYPTFDEYVKQFDHFADSTPKGGTLLYCEEDDLATVICRKERADVQSIDYQTHKHKVVSGQTFLITDKAEIPVKIFGRHNMQNISGAKAILKKIGMTSEKFYQAIQSFSGAKNRMELVKTNDKTSVYKDFAHAPSKVEATTIAMKEQYPKRKLVACLELYTFSSLNKKFINQYKNTIKSVDFPVIYHNPKNVQAKNLEPLSEDEIKLAFKRQDILLFTDEKMLKSHLTSLDWENKNLLMMSSGNFGGLSVNELANVIIK